MSTGESSHNGDFEAGDHRQVVRQVESGKTKKKWQRVQRGIEGLNLHPTQWILEGCGLMGQHRIVMGFDQVEAQTEFGRKPSVVIKEFSEKHLIQQEGGTMVPQNQRGALSMERMVSGSELTSLLEEMRRNSKRTLEEERNNEAPTLKKKKKMDEVSKRAKKVAQIAKNAGSSSRGGGG